MDNNSSEIGAKFGFNKPNADKDKQTVDTGNSPVEGNDAAKVAKETPVIKVETPVRESEDIMNSEYTDHRSVTIALVKNYSLYRKANDKVLPKRSDYIGGSVSSSRILSANKEEVETYFPNLIGLAPNNENFITRVKQYLNNIRIQVDELGRTFDISFNYYHKRDYYKIKEEEEKIEATYLKANRQDLSKLKAALQDKITKLNVLESGKCKLGYPVNIDDYLMYRHCLLYRDIAKDVSLINSDPSIRFYFKDDQKEAEKLRKYRLEVNRAKANYVTCLAKDSLFDAIYVQYCVSAGLPVISSLAEDRLTREIQLDKFSTDEPIKFNKMFNNRDTELIGTIETLIARGELVRYPHNQNIMSVDGDFIGGNIGEAVVWFKNPENRSVVDAYYNKLKNI